MFQARTNESNSLFALRWTARLLSVITIGFLLLFILGGEANWSSVRPVEIIGLVFFPFGMMFGLMLAWRREMAGGIVAVGSIVLFYLVYGIAIRGTASFGWWIPVLSIPGAVFLLYAALRHEHWNGDYDLPATTGK